MIPQEPICERCELPFEETDYERCEDCDYEIFILELTEHMS